MSIKIGLAPGAWRWSGGGSAFFRFVEDAEAQGWDSIWLSDRLISDQLSLEPVTALAAAAARTSTMKFGTSVLALPYRNPVVLAKELATVDFLAGGRLLPAVGLGGDDLREYEATGTRKEERAARTDEAIGLLKRLWTEDNVTHHGKYYHVTNATVTPKPLFKPYPPIWIGGRTEFALRRVARYGDGWLAGSVTTTEVARCVELLQGYIAESGRDIEADHYGAILPVYLADSKEEALQRVPATANRTRPDLASIDQLGAFGTADDILARIGEYVEAGLSKFVLRPLCTEEESSEQLKALAVHVAAPINTHALPAFS